MSADWPEVTVEEVAARHPHALATGPFGSAISSKFFVEDGVPVIRGSNLSADVGVKLIDAGLVFVSAEKAKEFSRSIVRRGDLIFTCWGTINQVGMIHDQAGWDEYVISNKQMKLTVDPEKADPKYVYYVFSSPSKQAEVLANGIGAAVPGFNLGQLKKHVFKLPPLSVQREIVASLDLLDGKIQLNHQINQTLEQMAQAIFQSWFVDFEPVKAKIAALQAGGSAEDALLAAMQVISGKAADQLARMQAEQPEQYAELRATAELFPSAMQDSELGEIPEGWRVGEVSELFELHRGFDLPQSKRVEGKVPVYAAGGVHGNHNIHKMEPPGIITGRSGVIGNVYLSLNRYWPLNTTLYVRDFRGCGPYYAYHLLTGMDLKSFNSGSAVPSLNRNFVHAAKVCVPGDEVLSKFEGVVGPFFEAIASNANQADYLGVLRDTLLPKLLSGELTLPDIEARQSELENAAHATA